MFSNNSNNVDNNIPTGNNQAAGKKSLLVPIMSIAVFMVLIFSAGYAYFTAGSAAVNTATHNITLPSRTTMTSTATPICAISVPYNNMVPAANSTTAKSSAVCYVAVTCSGSTGGQCKYNVTLNTAGTPVYARSTGANNTVKEYTAQVTALGTGCTVQNASTTEQQIDGLANKVIATCTLTPGQTGNTAVTFKWYNANIIQNDHAGKTYRYKVSSVLTSIT